MDCYIKSIGRNSFLILNCAPMPDGSVHPDDMKREAYQYGERVRAYEIEGFDVDSKQWISIAAGTSMDKRKIDVIDMLNVFSKLKAKITTSVGMPLINQFQVHPK